MKTLVILLADYRCTRIFDGYFAGKSSFDLCMEWAERTGEKTVVLASASHASFASRLGGNVVLLEKFDTASLAGAISEQARIYDAGTVVYSYADLPFLNKNLTDELLNTHEKYQAEYTFADGFPYGFAPEILDSGTASILKEIASGVNAEQGAKKICRTSLFDLIKTDINSFEIETVLSETDWRLYRMSFDCGSKSSASACRAVFESGGLYEQAEKTAEYAAKNPAVLKTVPSYYNVQISGKCSSECLYVPSCMQSTSSSKFMGMENFCRLVKNIADFSENAVISLSAFGEALYNQNFPDFVEEVLSYPCLNVLVETDGQKVNDDLCMKIKNIADKAGERTGTADGLSKIIWIVKIDAVTEETYEKINGNKDGFEKAVDAAVILSKYFPDSVYPQFTRMDQNEAELEKFYRFWSERTNSSGGNLIIQKYSNFCGVLEDFRPADLSPLDRNPCWHIRRDMTVFVDGNVPVCRESLNDSICGNVFTDGIEKIWEKITDELKNHMKNIYCEKCRKCDEYYTFNF